MKYNRLKVLGKVLMVVLVSTSIVSCLKSPDESKGPADSLVGNWKYFDFAFYVDNGDTIRFQYEDYMSIKKIDGASIRIEYDGCHEEAFVTENAIQVIENRCLSNFSVADILPTKDTITYSFSYPNKDTVYVWGYAVKRR